MDRNTIIAFVLAFLVLMTYQLVFINPSQVRKPLPPVQNAVQNAPLQTPLPVKAEIDVPSLKPRDIVQSRLAEQDMTVDTSLFTAVFSSKGGVVKSFKLKKFHEQDGTAINLVKESEIPGLAIGSNGNFALAGETFEVSGKNLSLNDSNKTGSIVFEYAGSAVSVRRTYTFSNDTYGFELKDETTGLPEYELTTGAGFGISDSREETGIHIGPVLLTGNDREEFTLSDLKEKKTFTGYLKWIAVEDKYFFSAIVPTGAVDEARVWANQKSGMISFKAKPGVNTFMVFAGPKNHSLLEQYKVNLEHIVDFGFFSIIARPVFWILKFLYSILGNYGWAIIVLTVILRIPFIPLMNKGQRAMKKMQAIQPKLKEIQEKYKNDAQRKNQEMMELYRKHKVNPMSGCLPILIQIPIFFALNKVLLVAIELRQAPFILWITDLSLKDPYFILPVGFGLSMFIQQKMTPATSADPQQLKMTKMMLYIMPVMLTWIFTSLASGLTLYFFMGNILSIAQQIYVNKTQN